MRRCGKYLGDNDATCPQLTCIRAEGHPGACDNVSDAPDAAETLANARLIAAAPDLLDACRAMLAWLQEREHVASVHHPRALLEAAIAKAVPHG